MGAVGPRRSPSEGGYARGQETRLRIIETAIPLFARLGFENTSTREIAAEAGVNPPALQYYFDSKEGLYRACAEHIADLVTEVLNPELDRAERLLRDGEPPQALIEGYCGLISAMAELLFCRPEAESWSPMMAREQAGLGPAIAFPLMRERFLDRLNRTCAGLYAAISGRAPDDPDTLLRMMAMNGQLKACHIGRRDMLACLGWDDITPEKGRLIKGVIVDQIRMLLTAEWRARGPEKAS